MRFAQKFFRSNSVLRNCYFLSKVVIRQIVRFQRGWLLALAVLPLLTAFLFPTLKDWLVLPNIIAVFFLPGWVLLSFLNLTETHFIEQIVLGFGLSISITLAIVIIFSTVGLETGETIWCISLLTVSLLWLKKAAPEKVVRDANVEAILQPALRSSRNAILNTLRNLALLSLLILLTLNPLWVINNDALQNISLPVLILTAILALLYLVSDSDLKTSWLPTLLILMILLFFTLINQWPFYQSLPRFVRIGVLGGGMLFYALWYFTVKPLPITTAHQNAAPPKFVSLLWVVLISFAFLFFLQPYLMKPGWVVGWDVPAYIWYAKHIGDHGFWNTVALVKNTMLISPALSNALHLATQVDFITSEKLVRAIYGTMACSAIGYLVLKTTRSHYLSIVGFVFSIGWFTIVRMIQDVANNLIGLIFVLLALALFQDTATESSRANRTAEFGAGLFWFIACISHLITSPIFLLMAVLFRFFQWVDSHRRRQYNGLFSSLWRSFRAIIIGQTAAVVFWLPSLKQVMVDLLFQSSANVIGGAGGVTGDLFTKDPAIILDTLRNSGLFINAPWLVLGGMVCLFYIYRSNALARVTFAFVATTATLAIFFPGGLAYRIYLLIPFPLLMTMAVIWMFEAPGSIMPESYSRALIGIIVLITVSINLASVANYFNTRPAWITKESNLPALVELRDYLNDRGQEQYIFLAYDETTYSWEYSTLWFNIIQEMMYRKDVREFNLYFGSLDSLLCNTPIHSSKPWVMNTYNYWLNRFNDSRVVETFDAVIIVDSFVPRETFMEYAGLSYVDPILPGVLMVDRQKTPTCSK